jgi:sugar phosphate isomerase/epimerase
MILSCLPVSLFGELNSGRMPLGDWLRFAKECGFDAADISVHTLHFRSVRQVEGYRREIEDAGIPVAMMTTYPDFTTPDKTKLEAEVIHAKSDVALAGALGISHVRLTAGQFYRELDEYKMASQAAECFEACCETAEKFGVSLLLENHSKPGAWDREDFDFNIRRFDLLLEKLKGLPVGINFDTANAFLLGEDAVSLFEKYYPRIASIHVNDAPRIGELKFCEVGCGKAPVAEVLALAKKRGFDGLISIEEASGKGKEGIARAEKTVRKMLL